MQFPMIPHAPNAFPRLAFSESRKKAGYRFDPTAYGGDLFFTNNKPFFHILTDSGIASLFLEAVAANAEDAWSFVSKNYVNAIDLDALRDVLGTQSRLCRWLVKASFSSDPKNCSTSSVLVVDSEHNEKSLLHLHMIKEPDRFGQWKIYGVEQE